MMEDANESVCTKGIPKAGADRGHDFGPIVGGLLLAVPHQSRCQFCGETLQTRHIVAMQRPAEVTK